MLLLRCSQKSQDEVINFTLDWSWRIKCQMDGWCLSVPVNLHYPSAILIFCSKTNAPKENFRLLNVMEIRILHSIFSVVQQQCFSTKINLKIDRIYSVTVKMFKFVFTLRHQMPRANLDVELRSGIKLKINDRCLSIPVS